MCAVAGAPLAVQQTGSSVDELLAEINSAEVAAQQQQAKKVQAEIVNVCCWTYARVRRALMNCFSGFSSL